MRSLPQVMLAAMFLVSSAESFCQTPASSPDHELAEMIRRYKLDSDQRREIKPILESEAEDLKIISSNSSLSPEQRGERCREVRRVCNREIEAVLHDRQRMLFDHDQVGAR
jgi:hypothetical protein